MTTPRKILDLVAVFDRDADAYRAGHYNEAQIRQEFVKPFVKCLGWDMDNEAGWAEAYKDVIHKDTTRSVTQLRRPAIASGSGHAQVLPGNQETIHQHRRQSGALRSARSLRMLAEAPAIDPDRIRRI
jgi:hypothetical protein